MRFCTSYENRLCRQAVFLLLDFKCIMRYDKENNRKSDVKIKI